MNANHKDFFKAIGMLSISALCLLAAYAMGRVLLSGRPDSSQQWPQLPSLSEQSILGIDKSINKAKAEEMDPLFMADHKQWSSVDVQLIDDPVKGDADDWVRAAQKTNKIVRSLFGKDRRGFLRIGFASPINKGHEWATVFVDTNKLPQNWQSLNYLQLFGRLDVSAGYLASRKWQCQFNINNPDVLANPVDQMRYCDELLQGHVAAASAQ